MKELWVEKYRPKKVEDYVFRDASQKKQVKSWIKEGSIPHLLLSGAAGIGIQFAGNQRLPVGVHELQEGRRGQRGHVIVLEV
jgi:hypothetical protein